MATLSYVLAALAALAAGACLAVTGLLQQRAASQRPRGEQLRLRLIVELAQNRLWLTGIGMALVSYGFQAVALALGPLALVQPLIVSELVFAIPISVRWRGATLRRREWVAILAVLAGLTVGILSAYPHGGDPLQPFSRWVYALVGVGVVAGGAVLLGRLLQGPVRASLFALSGATVLALQSGLFAATIGLLQQGVGPTFVSWQPYALIVASLLGMFLVENAYHAGPLAASMPVMDGTLPLVSIGIGVALFGEQVRTGNLALAGTALGLVLLLAGFVGLDTSGVIRRQQRVEHEEKDQTAAEERAE